MTSGALFGDTFAQLEWRRLCKRFRISQIIETGTNMGGSCPLFSELADTVWTIEINREYFEEAMKYLEGFRNVHMLLGSSPGMIRSLPAQPQTMFLLDAHWGDNWPLLDELKAIHECGFRPPIIVIDDVKVPGRNFQFDSYGGVENTIGHCREKLSLVFGGEFDWFYNNQSTCCGELYMPQTVGVGKMYVGPSGEFDGLYFVENGNNYSNL